MNPRWRHVLRRTWFFSGGVLAALAIALAVLMALGQLLVPLAAHYPDRVAQMISAQLHRPVSFASMQGYWQPSGPMLVLHHVEIGRRNGQPLLTLPSAKVKLDFGALVSPSRHWVNLRLSGLELTLKRDAGGQWHVAGFGVAGKGHSHHITLGDLPGNLWLNDMQLNIVDARSGHHYRVRVGPLRLSNGGGELRFAGLLHRADSSQALKVAGKVRDGGHSGRLYLAANGADLGAMFAGAGVGGYAVESGQGTLALWVSWQDRRLTGATASVHLSGLVLKSPVGTVKAPTLQGLVQFRRHGDTARVLFAPGTRGAARVDISGIGGNTHVVVRAQHLDPGSWLALAALAPGLPASLGHWLATAAPTVHVLSAHLDWSHAQGIRALSLHFNHLGFAAVGKHPGVNHIHGVLLGDGGAVSLQLPAQPLTIDFPHVFRKPLVFSSVGGNVAVWRSARGWHVGSGGIHFKSKGLGGQLRGSVRLPAGGGAPFMNVYAAVAHANIVAIRRFLPTSIMNQQATDWLDHGLVSGSLDDARVILHGDLANWPFTGHKGRFEAQADISGLALHYLPKWPEATGINVAVDFVDNGLMAVATAGGVNGIKTTRAVASIPDFTRPELILNAQGHGKGGALLGFVRKSPLGSSHAKILDKLKLGGQGQFNFSLVVPLSSRVSTPLTVGGTVRLQHADFSAPAWKLKLGDLHGLLAFNIHGFQAHGLKATLRGQPVTLSMAAGPPTGHPNWPLKVSMRGRFSLAQLLKGRKQLASMKGIGSGSALFKVGFHIDTQADNPLHATRLLNVHSDLRGIKLDLPAPLAKPAQAIWPLHVQLGLPFAGGHLRVILGNKLYARVHLPSKRQPVAVDVHLGGAAPSGRMPSRGIRIRGRVAHLDISDWVHFVLSAATGAGGRMPPIDVDVTAAHTHIFSQKFKKLHIKFHTSPKQLSLAVDGPNVKGTVTVPVHRVGKRGIVARFDHLYWPKMAKKKSAPSTASGSLPMASAPTPQQAAAVGVAPSSLPPLHVWVGHFHFGDAHLGHVRLETRPTPKGMHIDMLRAQSKSLYMSATGYWNGTDSNSHTHLEIDFSAASLGHMLDAFGYSGIIIGGETHAHLDATWPGGPSSFTLANVGGKLGVKIGPGRIPKVKPGVGRLFGLMSIAELPRRLTSDFGSFFGKGLGFDSITGHFRFHEGVAYTRDFTLKGPSINVHVTGRVNFRTHELDQYVVATPHIGNTLPIVGGVVAGPIGIAAGLAIQGLLGHGLNQAASVRYHITGSWNHPKFTKVSGQAPAPAPATSTSKRVAQPAHAAANVH